MSYEHCPAVIVVFASKGCPHCEEYKPRLEHQVKRFQDAGVPFVIVERSHIVNGEDRAISPMQIPVLLYNAMSEDPLIQRLADRYDVQGLPTTLLFTRRLVEPEIHIGAVEDRTIYDLLYRAATA